MRVREAAMTILAEVVRRYETSIGATALVSLMGALGFPPAAVRTVIFRLRREHLLEARKERGRAIYTLTESAQQRLEAGNRRTFETARESWDGLWRILTYNVPERQRSLRDELRKDLIWLGFGQLSVSTWVSPRRVTAYVNSLIRAAGMQRYVHLFEARHVGLAPSLELVNQAWDLQAIAEAYADVLREIRSRWSEQLQSGRTLSDKEAFAERINLVARYQRLLDLDPWLPIELLPSGWIGEEARRTFWGYYLELSPQADSFLHQHLG